MDTQATVLVLAGGVGKRLWPLTGSKALFPFAGEPLLLTHLRTVAKAGFRRFVIVVSPQDREIVQKFTLPGVRLAVVVQDAPLGMGDAVLRAESAVGDAPCLIMNAGDVVGEELYRRMGTKISDRNAFVIGKKVDRYFDGGYLRVDGQKLVGIEEKPGEGREPSDLVNLVFHFFPRFGEFVSSVRAVKSVRDDVYEKGLAAYLQRHEVQVVGYGGIWFPFKYPWHVLDILHWRLSQLTASRGKNVQLGKNVSIEGPVVLEDDVRVFENTKIIGPAFIGQGGIIGNNNIIRESHIGGGCVTGFNTDITRSWIGEGCWFHSNYIGDSVLAGDVSMGSGAKIGNLRLDEGEISSVIGDKKLKTGRNKLGVIAGRGVRMGINASIMPGVKVGSNAFVGAGVVLDQDLQDNMFCYAKKGYEIKPNTKSISPDARQQFKAKI